MPEFFGCLMEKFDSISHFLQSGEFDCRVFDMGRKVTLISNDIFEKIENQGELYPYPFQQKSWLALLFWSVSDSNKKEPVIWFLQFPVDEMGFLKQDARDGFLIALLEQAGKNIQAKLKGENALDELNESPYAFKPQPDRLAMFHAFAMKELNQGVSKYYRFTRDYLSGKTGYEQWQFLGLQGIADVVVCLGQDDNESLLAEAIALMPPPPLESFCRALENIEPQGILVEALISRLNLEIEEVQERNVILVSVLIRALSSMQPENLRHDVLMSVLSSSFGKEIEVLAAVSGRAWGNLRSKPILDVYISNLAHQDQAAFNAILMDLMMLPHMKQVVLDAMRNPDRSIELSYKFSQFMLEIPRS